jgi:hypothetical protein
MTVKTKKNKKINKVEIRNSDGSVSRYPGKEPLIKPNKDLRKSIMERWALIKVALSHEESFLPMITRQAIVDMNKTPEQDAKEQTPDQDQQQQQDQDQQQQQDQDEGQQDQDQQQQQDQDEGQQDQPDEEYDEQKLIELLKQEGYSDPEIAHIVSGHVPSQPSQEELKTLEQQQKLSHKDDMHGLTVDHQKTSHDIELEHKKRMLDLEHEHAKKEKEIRIRHLEEELKTKLEQLKNKQSQA